MWVLTSAVLATGLSLLHPHPTHAVSPRPEGWSQGPSLPSGYDAPFGVDAAYFPPANEVVLFGGGPKLDPELWNNRTWLYQNGQWSQAPAAPSELLPRVGAAMAYDPDIGKIVLFGGEGPDWPFYDDTWLFDGTRWSPGPTTPPDLTPRAGARMVYDPAIHKLVMFGGAGLVPYTETWLFDGSTWTRGPASPPALAPRAYFGMTYDAALQKVFVMGGDGDTDTWYFDGSSWTAGPSTDRFGAKERVTVDYDPQLGGPVVYGGLGPGSPTPDLWLLRGGAWFEVPASISNAGWPPARFDGDVVWNPTEDALMVIGGVSAVYGGHTGFDDTWFFREITPQVASAQLSPTNPTTSTPITLNVGAETGGYMPIKTTYTWFINGVRTSITGTYLATTQFQHGDQIYAKVALSDGLGIPGPTLVSNTVTVADNAPSIGAVVMSPGAPYVTDTIRTSVSNVSDPEGDAVTLHYVWKVNGTALPGNDQPSLAPGPFTAGDVISVTVTPVDSAGVSGASGSDTSSPASWNINPNGAVAPGFGVGIKGGGYQPSEKIDIRLDSPSAPKFATITATTAGDLPFTTVTIPSPATGGTHTLYGVGETSGTVGRGPVSIVPAASVNPKALHAGDATTFTGVGYRPGETVSVAFPGGQPVSLVADSTGTVMTSLVSPPEPRTGGQVLGTAPSGSAGATFTVLTTMTAPASSEPQLVVPIRVTGFGANEQVHVSFNSGPTTQTVSTDAWGTVDTNILLDTYYGGNQKINVTGVSSGLTQSATIDLLPQISVSPGSGHSGTVVTVTSGPGWVPGESVSLMWATTKLKSVTADSSGSINTTFVVPQHVPGAVNVKLTDTVLGQTATGKFNVT